MSEPFIGEIRMFGGTFAPRSWAFCDGQLLAINSNQSLFSILGTTYGGDGETTFGLPDMRGRVAMHAGSGPGLTPRELGAKTGAETVQLTTNEMPSHNHGANSNLVATPSLYMRGSSNDATTDDPTEAVLGVANQNIYLSGSAPDEDMAADTVGGTIGMSGSTLNAGGNQAHTNIQPCLVVNYIIATVGTFPSRN